MLSLIGEKIIEGIFHLIMVVIEWTIVAVIIVFLMRFF